MSPSRKTSTIKQKARELGFSRTRIARASRLPRADYLERFLSLGRAGEMAYLHRNSEIRADPRHILPGARSVIVSAMNYYQPQPAGGDEGEHSVESGRGGHARPATGDGINEPRGRVAKYAWGEDYHVLVKDRLKRLVDFMRAAFDEPFESRVCVDTAPINERALAAEAGVGWIGKNTLVLHQDMGSYFFLGEIVTTLELAVDGPVTDHCGTCTRCLEACPTDAFPAPYEMDASRCLSYLTIEHRGEIPTEFHENMGDWIFGCDVCQQVCPFNRDLPTATEFGIRPPGPNPSLQEVINWSATDYKRRTKGSATDRATLDMIKRNARIALRNSQAERHDET